MQKVNWLVVGIISAVVLLLLFGGGMMGGSMMGGGGMMGYGGYGMMNWGFSPFGWVGMFFMWLIPASLVALAVLGVVWLVRKTNQPTPPSS